MAKRRLNDQITLTIPREQRFHRVAHLVVGGVAVRLNLTFENLDDLEVALESLLERAHSNGDVTVTVTVSDHSIRTLVGPFEEKIRSELESAHAAGIGLRRVLDTVVDHVELSGREDGQWVELTKNVTRGGPSG